MTRTMALGGRIASFSIITGLLLTQVGCAGCSGDSDSEQSEKSGLAGSAGHRQVALAGRASAGTAGRGGTSAGAARPWGVTGVDANFGGDGGASAGPCAPCVEQHRTCEPSSSSPTCGSCLPTFVTNGDTCGCPQEQVVYQNSCVTCAGNFVPTCNLDRETGQIVRLQDSSCICDTKAGYFHSLDSHQAEPCDADGDGWVNDTAQPAIESTDPALAAAAKCTVRKITHVTLVNSSGKSLGVPLGDALATSGLPLYESARNDGAAAATQHPLYGSTALASRALNSLTKACYTKNGDYNDNGVSDIVEWTGTAPMGRAKRNTNLERYYQEYLRFGGYIELYDGWFAPPDEYVIRERSRVADSQNRIPQQYSEGVAPHWQNCERHIDADYRGKPKSRAGGDFSEFGDTWGGMTQSSQFKCVELLSTDDYGGRTRQANPESVFWSPKPAGFARATVQGGGIAYGCRDEQVPSTIEIYDWAPNTCSAAGTQRTNAEIDAINPSFANIQCNVVKSEAIPTLSPGVYWMSVGYENHACSETEKPTAAGYVRGCINECVEWTVTACPNWDTQADPSSGRFTCDDENRAAFGRLQCGCGRHYGGKNCEIGCPGDWLFTSNDFDIETRLGYWTCLSMTASSGVPLNGTSSAGVTYTVTGYVPAASADDHVLQSPDGKLRVTAR